MSILREDITSGLTNDIIHRLKANGITKITDLISRELEDVCQSTGLSYKDMSSVVQVLLAQYSALPVTGDVLYSTAVQSTAILSTGCSSLDSVLDGGLYTGQVTEVAGDIAVGKTQVCFSTVAATAAYNEQNVIYIDTGGVFSASRVLQFVDRKSDSKAQKVLSHIQCAEAFTVYEVLSVLEEIRTRLQNQQDDFYGAVKLVVLDNVASVIYPLLGGGSFSESQGLISLLGRKLKCLAVDFSVAILVTNNVVTSDKGVKSPSLGRTWSHVPNTRILISQSDDNPQQTERTAMVIKNSRGPVNVTVNFKITETGLKS